MNVTEVLSGSSKWAVVCTDNLLAMQSMPDGCCGLTVTSPPYSSQRTYSIGFKLEGEEWVSWMIPRVVEMCRVTAGLVCINMSAPVKDHKYQPVVEWLVSDLTRHHGIVCGASPYCYFRFGIPGSGGKRYHRRDFELVYTFARPESLPLTWSDNTACGHPPKWAPGGEMSNRLKDGQRVSKWGSAAGNSAGRRGKNGKRQTGHSGAMAGEVYRDPAPGLFGEVEEPTTNVSIWGGTGEGGCAKGARKADGDRDRRRRPSDTPARSGQPEVLANPGNVIRQTYDAEAVRQLFEATVTGRLPPGDVIRCLVGGGAMGSQLAHENEAPMPEKLVEFFVLSYAMPDSVVLDPFVGSGTTLSVAVAHGRRAIGCDIRESQCDLTRRRLSGITPSLFPEPP